MPESREIPHVPFTEEMKKDYTILVPNMLPIQIKLILALMRNFGYHMEVLETEGPQIAETGLKNVHNDTCYPALLVIGQLIDALESGAYDPHKVALMLPQTGGGCRASNYIHLLRKALLKLGYDYIPVISLNFSGLEKNANPGFKLTMPMIIQIGYGALLGDLIMMLYNQCRPYVVHEGDADRAVDELIRKISSDFAKEKILRYGKVRTLMALVVKRFAQIELKDFDSKPKVGIVGEIYVKFSPLGNNNLEKFLLSEGTEPVLPGLIDFCMYWILNHIYDSQLYGRSAKTAIVMRGAYKFLCSKQKDMITMIRRDGHFRPPMPFEEVRRLSMDVISPGVKMGEGWLLPGEMVELINEGVNNIVLTQPFGCLPNHIAGKGMVRRIREIYPQANIVSVDYDPGASRINQENRIKLMLSAAKE
ncbi:MAG: 2-hydroxyglutaryl-CoA dehydratase [Butyricicoccus sp.]|jgi:predicted nucleotide-binding protein (sugar kinase/HSP70/actin superfamily)